jgi:hypothetical protein
MIEYEFVQKLAKSNELEPFLRCMARSGWTIWTLRLEPTELWLCVFCKELA